MTQEQEQLVLQILSQLHKRGFVKHIRNDQPFYACVYCQGAGFRAAAIEHAEGCVYYLSKRLAGLVAPESQS